MGNFQTFGWMTFCICIILLMTFNQPIFNYCNSIFDELYIDVEHEGLVTDKWIINKPVWWIIGNTDKFYLEINNDFTVKVDDFEYYNTNIGGFRNWTTTELREEYNE